MKEKNQQIAKLGFVCAVMVIALHSYSLVNLIDGKGVLSVLGRGLISYVSHGLTTVAVPIFFFLSGYLLFKNVDTLQSLLAKLKRRIKSLIIPYVCWNTLYFLYYILTSNLPIRTADVKLDYTALGIIEAIFFHKYCFNLWFLLNLIVFTFVLSVPIFYLSKTKAAWLVWVLLLCSTLVISIELNVILTEEEISVFSASYFVYWFMGALWSKKEMPCSNNKLALVGYVMISIAVMYVKETENFTDIEFILVLANMICFLMSVNVWSNTMKIPKHNMNMFLYGGAGFVQIVYIKVAMTMAGILEIPVVISVLIYFVEILLTAVVCYYAGLLIKKYLPPVYVMFAGNR